MLIVPEVVPTIRGDYDLNEPRQETAGVFLTSTARISPDKEMTVKARILLHFPRLYNPTLASEFIFD